MQAQRLMRMFRQVLAHHAHALFHQIVAGGDQRRQIAGAARFFIRALHDFQRFNADGFRRIVKLHAAAAVELHINKTGGQYGTCQRTLLNARRQFRQRAESVDQAIGDNKRMVIQNFMAGKNPTMG